MNLLDQLVQHVDLPLPEGFDSWGVKSVRDGRRTYGGYEWPAPGGVATATDVRKYNRSPCPLPHPDNDGASSGDGLCVGRTWSGMASGGMPAKNLLLVAYRSGEVLGANDDKLRTKTVAVVAEIDGWTFLRRANLPGGEPARGEPARGGPARGGPARGEPVRGEPA